MNISSHSPYMQEQQGPPSEERAHGTVSMKTYYKYFRAGGNCLFLFTILVVLFAAEVSFEYAGINQYMYALRIYIDRCICYHLYRSLLCTYTSTEV